MDINKKNIEELNDLLLWKDIISGDEISFEKLFKKYYNSLYRFGNFYFRDKDLVEDSIHDVFLEIWKYKSNLNPDVKVKAYLYSCFKNRVFKKMNISRRIFTIHEEQYNPEFEFSVEEILIRNEYEAEKIQQLNHLINQLSPKQKEIIYLRYFENLSLEDISTIMNINYQSVKNLLHRTIAKFKDSVKIK